MTGRDSASRCVCGAAAAGVALVLVHACAGMPAPRPDETADARSETADARNAAAVPSRADIAPFVAARPDALADTTIRHGVRVRLTELSPTHTAVEPQPPTAPLADAEAVALLDRLAGPPPQPPEPTAFRFASGSLPAPRPGATTRIAFATAVQGAAATVPEAVAGQAPRVVRMAPRGVIATTSQISVMFSRPMAHLGAMDRPPPGVRLTPAVRGAWRWLDPSTLVFEAAGELPKATRYTVDIPAGLAAPDGTRLREAVSWTFATSAPAVREVVSMDVPDASQPVIAIGFDQPVDAAAVLPLLRLEIDGRDVPLRAATLQEQELRPMIPRVASAPERLVAVRPVDRVPAAGDGGMWDARLHVAAGLASLEGPERTDRAAVHDFRMRKGLGVVEYGCGRAQTCVPGAPWTIRFTHPLRPLADTASWVRVEPALPGATVEIWQNHLVVLGAPEPHTTYTVRLDPAIASYAGGELGSVPPLHFAIGALSPAVWTPGGALGLLPPGSTAYPILAQATDSVRVEVRAVSPADWPAYERALYALRDTSAQPQALPGHEVRRAVVPVTLQADGITGEAWVELGQALAEAGGHVLLVASPVGGPPASAARPALTWVQRGGLLLDVAEDAAVLTVRALSADGRPLAGVDLELRRAVTGPRGSLPPLATARTGADGVAVLAAGWESRPSNWLLMASHGGNTVLMPAVQPGEIACCPLYEWRPQLRRHLITDRPLYAPGDTVRFAGWLRRVGGIGHEPTAPAPSVAIAYSVRDPRGATVVDDTIAVQGNGRLEGVFVLPPEANAGPAIISLSLLDGTSRLGSTLFFDIQEVRRPNFDVALELDPGPHLPGTRIQATALATYFTGGGLPAADMRWQVRSSRASYVPPGASGYSFGPVRYAAVRWQEPRVHNARTDAAGAHDLGIDIEAVHPNTTMQLHVQATAMDLDRQSRTVERGVLVHPAAVYVGLRTPARFVRRGEALMIDAVVVDIDGRASTGRPILIRALRQEPRFEGTRLEVTETERGRCTVRSEARAVRCRLNGLPAGDYMIVARVEDAQGRHSESELTVRVAGETIPAGAGAERDTIAVALDRERYEPGDTALLWIETSLRAAEALLTVRRAGVLDSRTLRIANGTASVRLPVTDAYVPNVHVHVTAVGPDARMVSGNARAAVAPATRALEVTVEPQAEEVAPGAATRVVVTVRDAAGKPVEGADVVLRGVDEALLALSRRRMTDPLDDIYATTSAGVIDRTLRVHAVPTLERVTGAGVIAGAGGIAGAGAGVIAGVVIDGLNGRPLGGAWVEAPGVGGAWTGVDGTFRIDGVPAGQHAVQARAQGYVSAHAARVTVPLGGAGRAHFLLLTRAAVLAGGRQGVEQLRFGAASLELSEGVRLPFTVAAAAVELSALTVGVANLVAPPPPPAATPAPTSPAESALRSEFTPVAAFVADARTGPDGRVEIPVTVSHSLTRYRLRAVAAAGERRFGTGEASFTVRRPLMVRPVPPRFLNQGDRFELTVLVENRSDAVQEVDVAVRAVNADVAEPFGRRVRVPANDRVELRFPAVAGTPGSARFQVAASAGAADAAEAVIPVLLPAVTESYAVYGELDDARAVAYPLRLPTGMLPDQTRVAVGFATTAVHGLRDALLFLIDCFFELPEVWASRILALSALRNAPAAMPWPVDAIDAMIRADVSRLARAQLRDGSWSVWSASFDADPFLSVHAAHALARAAEAGLSVPEHTRVAAARWLERVDEHAPSPTSQTQQTQQTPNVSAPLQPSVFAADYPLQARRSVQAYALDVRRRLGHDVSASAAALLRDAGVAALPAEALAWLLPALASRDDFAADAAEVRRELDARVVRSAGTAAVVSPYDAGGRDVYHSPRRTDAVVLAAFVEAGAPSDLVAAMARGLMAHRVRGRWSNTQENAFAVAALVRYLSAAEATEPALVARAWAGPRLAAEQSFRGRADGRAELTMPADSLGEPGTELDVTLAREGAGRLYYRVALSYAAAGLSPPVARGFEVTRTYEAVDDPADVRRDANGTWRVRLGARVRVRVTVATAGPRYHVALVDPLPAGLEAVNPALAGTAGMLRPGTIAPGSAQGEVFFAEHVNVRADRFEAFRTLLQPGRSQLTYIALAGTAGDFAAPAPRAEEMYSPETFGRGAAERLIVEARAQ